MVGEGGMRVNRANIWRSRVSSVKCGVYAYRTRRCKGTGPKRLANQYFLSFEAKDF